MNDFSHQLSKAKDKWPLDAVMRKLGYGDEYLKASCKSPFRDEKEASWGVFKTEKGELKFKDLATGESGDQVDFIAMHLGCSTKDALDYFFNLAGINRVEPRTFKRPAPEPEPEPEPEPKAGPLNKFDWERCVTAMDAEQMRHFAKWRGYSLEFVQWLKEQKLVGIYDGCPATPVVKDGAHVGCQYRTKDGPRYANATPGAKTPAEPLIIGKVDAPSLLIMESQWDAFSIMEAAQFHETGIGLNYLGFAVTDPQAIPASCWSCSGTEQRARPLGT